MLSRRCGRCRSAGESYGEWSRGSAYEQVPIEYRRAARRSGRGASYPALLRLAFEALSAFSDVPLAIASWFGMLVAGVSAAAAVVIFILTLSGAVSASLGVWVLFAVLFLGGVQLVSVGILGRYLARVHAQVLERPLYLIDRVVRRSRGPPRTAPTDGRSKAFSRRPRDGAGGASRRR